MHFNISIFLTTACIHHTEGNIHGRVYYRKGHAGITSCIQIIHYYGIESGFKTRDILGIGTVAPVVAEASAATGHGQVDAAITATITTYMFYLCAQIKYTFKLNDNCVADRTTERIRGCQHIASFSERCKDTAALCLSAIQRIGIRSASTRSMCFQIS